MEKKISLIFGIVLVLVIGALFVKANLETEQSPTSKYKPPTCEIPQQTCSEDTCGLNCGGNCGIKSCGCS